MLNLHSARRIAERDAESKQTTLFCSRSELFENVTQTGGA
jgi:hypothetical protein